MSDRYNYNDPDFRRDMYRSAPTWVSLAAVGAIIAMFVLIGMLSGSDTQTSRTGTNAPAVETTGAGGFPAPTPAPGGGR